MSFNTTIPESDARLINRTVFPNNGGEVLERVWPFIDATEADGLITTARGKKVYDPDTVQIDGQLLTGTYWNVQTWGMEDSVDGQRVVHIHQKLAKVVSTAAPADAILQRRIVHQHDDSDETERFWPFINQSASKTLLDALQAVESYDSFQADALTYTAATDSCYWNAKAWAEEDESGIVVIRQRLILVFQTIPESAAQLVSLIELPSSQGEIITRAWPWIDRRVVDTYLATLRAAYSYPSIQADGQLYTATYWNAKSWAEEDPETGVAKILQKVVKVTNTTAESDAILTERTILPWPVGDTIERAWPFTDRTAADTLLTALKGVASYLNPKADNEPYTGTYWNAKSWVVEDDEGITVIKQLLILVRDSTLEPDAISVKAQRFPLSGGIKHLRAWPFIIPTSADTLIAALKGNLTVKDPQADEQTITGTFANSDVYFEEDQDTGICKIFQELTKIWDGASTSDLPTPEIDQAENIRHPFLTASEQGTIRDVVYRYPFINQASATQANIDALKPTVTDYTLVQGKFTLEPDKTATLWYLFRLPTWSNTLTANVPTYSRQTDLVNPSAYLGDGMQKQDVSVGMKVADALIALTNIAAETGYVLASVRYNETEENEANLQKTQEAYNVDKTYYVRQLKTAIGNEQGLAVQVWPRLKDVTVKDEIVAALGTSFTIGTLTYTHLTYAATPHPDGTWTVERHGIISKESGWRFFTETELLEWYGYKLLRVYSGLDTMAWYKIEQRRKITDSETTAKTYADESSTYPDDATASMGWVEYHGHNGLSDKFVAHKVTLL